MTSMRKLNRRLLRWRRYGDRTGWSGDWYSAGTYKPPPGWDRTLEARWREWERRNPNWADKRNDFWWVDA